MAHGMLLGLMALLLAACGGSELQRSSAGQPGAGALEADVFDSDADLFGGQCVIDTVNFGRATFPISAPHLASSPGSIHGSRTPRCSARRAIEAAA